jgi:tetratricopeptide (TPR) repeat protein
LKKESDQGWTLNALASSYGHSGQPRNAVRAFELAVEVAENLKNEENVAIALGNVAQLQMIIGVLRTVEANLRRSIGLCREIKSEFWEAVGRAEWGRLLAYRGVWQQAEKDLAETIQLFQKTQQTQYEGVTWAYRALRVLLIARQFSSPEVGRGVRAEGLSAARRALELTDETARKHYPFERDYVSAHWLLGAAYRLNAAYQPGELAQAEQHLSEALTRCRNINAVDHEADILLDLARLRVDQGEREEALRLAQEALLITERSEYVLQGADVHLLMAQLALNEGDKRAAFLHAREARRLATCDGPPDYTYKVAYDEAGQLLSELGEK